MLLGGLWLTGVCVNTAAASINTHVFIWAAPIAVAWFRQVVAAVALTGLAAFSRQRLPGRSRTWAWALVWGASLALNSGGFYASVERIPLGVATTLSFVGPVLIAAFGSHRRRDLVWAVGALVGVIAIARPSAGSYDALGLGFGLAGGAGWGLYMIAGNRVVRAWGPTTAAAAVTISAACVLAPVALLAGGFPIANPRATGILLCTASLGAALPYAIDSRVMQRLAPATFSVLQSLFPAVGVLVGLVALGQVPRVLDLVGVACVTVASAGALLASHRSDAVVSEETAANAVPLG